MDEEAAFVAHASLRAQETFELPGQPWTDETTRALAALSGRFAREACAIVKADPNGQTLLAEWAALHKARVKALKALKAKWVSRGAA
ncbi:MAG TPA: hypothetical protein VMS54_13310 [Vicinamibacterales bacterium]|nr:hypothetical protein [Vicinamibacterales bacterium]